ncbi:hypothetical protein A2645_00510 [Candidatus Nomurabacteria bacterium RIFCSPHIGHO2_01_FULL_39_9]|uniref:Phage shock protein PspC N-terminal domain-containing protein n=1 Tax=Candidatus Nomurabacteria bacterium RIFCSPHIGHO2_01_FULL_39_9 TaxID=1801735 RepID=A0A1F6UWP9_9BACT|nr:MAG: hypothetical protein A2645_00510 [Candidatus Nomurabacteria bacterium RIFCSPHIGHO2_01_FULL_39_9]
MIKTIVKKTWKKKFSKSNINDTNGSGCAIGCLLFFLAIIGFAIYWIFSGDTTLSPTYPIKEFKEHSFVRIPGAGWVGGVLAGIAYYASIPLWGLRLAVAAVIIFFDDVTDILIVAYILLLVFMPTINFIPADFIARAGQW